MAINPFQPLNHQVVKTLPKWLTHCSDYVVVIFARCNMTFLLKTSLLILADLLQMKSSGEAWQFHIATDI